MNPTINALAAASATALFALGAAVAFGGDADPHAHPAEAQAAAGTDPPPGQSEQSEHGILEHVTQLTFPERFSKAGESYFSPDGSKVIFQAVEAVAAGETPGEFYAMFVADVVRSNAGAITGLANERRISPPGSANTCGWFHPSEPDRVIFASTVNVPTESTPPGYQRASGRYRWMFPPEMRIVTCRLSKADGSVKSLEPVEGDGTAYTAEDSYSPDGKTLLFCSLRAHEGDLFVKDVASGTVHELVTAPGYDGGPFFSPDGKRICYRSDRRGDNHLQIFVADLAFDARGAITGITEEHQVTRNEHVNWCPFWHPSGRALVYATSEVAHQNYEIYIVDAISESGPPKRSGYGTFKRRVTFADGADVLPAFSADGKTMIWTAQRGADRSSQLWVADFVMPLEPIIAEPTGH